MARPRNSGIVISALVFQKILTTHDMYMDMGPAAILCAEAFFGISLETLYALTRIIFLADDVTEL